MRSPILFKISSCLLIATIEFVFGRSIEEKGL
jgi:hypothetical protein